MRAQQHVAVGAEDRAREREQRALEVGEGHAIVDGKTLHLMELRRVRRVVVRPVDAAGGDHIDRRRLGDHRAHLHRRGVDAQDRVVVDVEGVGAGARGVRGVRVERVEVVFHELDLGTFGDLEAEAEKDVLDIAARLRDQVQVPDGQRRSSRQRHIDGVGSDLASGEIGLLELESPVRFGCARRCPRRLLRRARRARAAGSCAAAAAARPCGRGTGSAAARAPSVARGPDCGYGFILQLGDAVAGAHGAAILVAS